MIVDEFVLAFGIDTTNFTEGQKKVIGDLGKVEEQAAKTGARMEESGKKAAGFYSEITKEVLTLIGAFAGADAIGAFVAKTTQADAALGRTALTLDMSAAALSRWEGAAQRAGAAGGSVTATFQNIEQQVQRARYQGIAGPLTQWARTLGVDLTDAGGKPLDPGAILKNLADKLKGTDPALAYSQATQAGVSGDLVPFLLKGRAGIDEMLSQQDQIGHTTQKDVNASTQLQTDMIAAEQAFGRVGEQLTTAFEPAIDRIVKALTGWAEWMQGWIDKHPEEAKEITEGVVGLGALGAGGIAARLLKKFLGLGGKTGTSVEEAAGATGMGLAELAPLAAVGYLFTSGSEAADDDPAWRAAHPGLRSSSRDQKDLTGGPTMWDRAKNFLKRNLTPGAYIRDQLIQMGHTPEDAAAIAANAMAESSGDKDNSNDIGGGHYGLFQLSRDRQAKFKAWSGHDIRNSTVEQQLRFNDFELQTSERATRDLMDAAQGTGEKAAIFGLNDERFGGTPAQRAAEAAKRAGYAEEYLRGIAPQPTPGARVSQSSSHSEIHIGKVDVHTQATDAPGIARDLHKSLNDYKDAAQSNSGLA